MTNDEKSLSLLTETPDHPPAETTQIVAPPDDAPVLRPSTQSLARIAEYFAPGHAITAADMVEVLNTDQIYDGNNETALFEQTRVLDALFHRLVAQSCGGKSLRGEPLPNELNEERLRIALMTQKLFRQTACALHVIRHPQSMPAGYLPPVKPDSK